MASVPRRRRPDLHTARAQDGAIEFSTVDPVTGQTRLLRRAGGAEHPMGVHPQLVTADPETGR